MNIGYGLTIGYVSIDVWLWSIGDGYGVLAMEYWLWSIGYGVLVMREFWLWNIFYYNWIWSIAIGVSTIGCVLNIGVLPKIDRGLVSLHLCARNLRLNNHLDSLPISRHLVPA